MRTHGRAYRVSRNDVRGYRHTEPPVRRVRATSPLRANPIGVTTLAAINGRGAHSARAAMRSASDRYGVARSAVRGEAMPAVRNPRKRAPTGSEARAFSAGFGRTFAKKKATTKRAASRKKPTPPPPRVSKAAEQKRRSRRESAYRRAVKAGYGKQAAARRAMHVEPFLKSQKARTFKGLKAYTGKATKKPLPKQYAKKTVTVKKRVTRKVPAKRKVRVAYGKYKRLRVTDPRTGQKKRSYLYKTKTGKRRKIPSYAIGGASSPKTWKSSRYDKAKKRIQKRRRTAAKRVKKRGSAFTPNRRKTMHRNKSTKRSRAAKKGWATRRAKKAARRSAAKRGASKRYRRNTTRRRATSASRATPNRRRTATRRRATTRRRKSATPNRRRAAARRKATPNRRRKTSRRKTTTRRRKTMRANRSAPRKDPRRVAAGKKAARTRKRRRAAGIGRGKATAGRYLKRGKVYYRGRKPKRLRGLRARKLPKARIYVTNRRRRSATRRRSSYRRNQFMASMKAAATSALFVTSGFIGHKALTHGLFDKLLMPQIDKAMNTNGSQTPQAVKTAVPIVGGAFTAALGVWITSKVVSRQRTVEIGAGMFTSWLHTVVVKLLDLSEATRPALPFVAGYDTASTAAAIGRYRRRRGVRGLGARDVRSILPKYAPAHGGPPGGIRQAVAGRGAGEYFATSGVGEYFASGVQGVGQYEPAGPMVTQAAAGLGQQIDNGIMPDQADAALTLAEAQAGTGRLGEYYSARPDQSGGYRDYRVPTESQLVPNNPLWAGTKPAHDTSQTSDIPAGLLESASGNGIF